MKKYVLPTLISLALSSSWALAQETSAPEMTPPAEPPAAMTQQAEPPAAMTPQAEPPAAMTPQAPMAPSDTGMSYQQFMEKQRAFQQETMEKQRTLQQEIQALRDKLRSTQNPEERQRLMDEMRQQQQEMREKMWKEGGGMMPGGPYGPGSGFGPGWGGPSGAMPPRYGARPGYQGKPYTRPGMPGIFRGSMLEHRVMVEKRLENIENLLKQVVELLKDK